MAHLVRRNSYQKYSKMVMFHSKLFVYWRVVNKVIIIMVTNRCSHKRRSNTKMPWGLRRGIMLVKNFNFTGVHGRIEIHLYFMGAIHQLTSGGTHFIYVNIETPLKGVLSCVTYIYIIYVCVTHETYGHHIVHNPFMGISKNWHKNTCQ